MTVFPNSPKRSAYSAEKVENQNKENGQMFFKKYKLTLILFWFVEQN